MMTLQELQKQVLQLPIRDRWRLVQSALASIEQETKSPLVKSTIKPIANLDPWTQSFVGLITLDTDDVTESYVDYLEEKYS
jgi:hypothetical protein